MAFGGVLFDIDGVIATIADGNQYDQAKSIPAHVQLVNSLYELGHEIILFTARGSQTGTDWKELTRKQMQNWGVKYTKLLFDKPAADYYVDDKNIDLNDIRSFMKTMWEKK